MDCEQFLNSVDWLTWFSWGSAVSLNAMCFPFQYFITFKLCVCVCVCVCVYMYLHVLYACVYRFLWEPEKGIRFSQAGVPSGCEALIVCAGNKTWDHKSSYPSSHLSSLATFLGCGVGVVFVFLCCWGLKPGPWSLYASSLPLSQPQHHLTTWLCKVYHVFPLLR